MLRWEYKIEDKYMSEKKLNELGADGWMLVGMLRIDFNPPSYYFRRPKDKQYQEVNSVSDESQKH